MRKRKIITIHEELCTGCGICVDACHEGAIELVNGVAKLVSDIYCDGLGDCLSGCPTGAIEIIEREAEDYDDDAVQRRMAERKAAIAGEAGIAGHAHVAGCPGSMARRIGREAAHAPSFPGTTMFHSADGSPLSGVAAADERTSELSQWPIQLHLVNPVNPYFDDANLLIAADCTAFAYGDFHREFIRNHITVIGCPKLDDNAFYAEKLTEILSLHSIRSITVARMVVPCCGGIVQAVKTAMLASRTIVPYREVIIGIDGQLVTG